MEDLISAFPQTTIDAYDLPVVVHPNPPIPSNRVIVKAGEAIVHRVGDFYERRLWQLPTGNELEVFVPDTTPAGSTVHLYLGLTGDDIPTAFFLVSPNENVFPSDVHFVRYLESFYLRSVGAIHPFLMDSARWIEGGYPSEEISASTSWLFTQIPGCPKGGSISSHEISLIISSGLSIPTGSRAILFSGLPPHIFPYAAPLGYAGQSGFFGTLSCLYSSTNNCPQSISWKTTVSEAVVYFCATGVVLGSIYNPTIRLERYRNTRFRRNDGITAPV